MRGITRAPLVAFLGILVVAAMFGPRAAADEFIDPNDPYDDTVLYTPQAAPADQALDLTAEALYPVAPAPEVVPKSPARRAPRPGPLRHTAFDSPPRPSGDHGGPADTAVWKSRDHAGSAPALWSAATLQRRDRYPTPVPVPYTPLSATKPVKSAVRQE